MPFPTITNEILDNEFLIKLFKNSDFWGVKALFSKQKIEMTPVKVISGACLAVKNEDFDTIGGFSEDYFMYSEDVDLCFRLHKLGKTNLYTNRCTVVHHGGGSAKQHPVSAFSTKMMLESKKKYFRKNHGPFYAFLFCIAIMLVSLARLILITISFQQFWAEASQTKICIENGQFHYYGHVPIFGNGNISFFKITPISFITNR